MATIKDTVGTADSLEAGLVPFEEPEHPCKTCGAETTEHVVQPEKIAGTRICTHASCRAEFAEADVPRTMTEDEVRRKRHALDLWASTPPAKRDPKWKRPEEFTRPIRPCPTCTKATPARQSETVEHKPVIVQKQELGRACSNVACKAVHPAS